MTTSSSPRPTLAQVLLGFFVVWQLVFLLAANFFGMLPHGMPETDEVTDELNVPGPMEAGLAQDFINFVNDTTSKYAQLTGQFQAWYLFAPRFPHQAVFPTVEFRWDEDLPPVRQLAAARPPREEGDEPRYPPAWAAALPADPGRAVELRSVLEPDDPNRYFRPFGTWDRLLHYEFRLSLLFLYWTEDYFDSEPDGWSYAINDRVRRQWKSIRAYLRWRLDRFQQEHPELPPPKQVVLSIRLYRCPGINQQPIVWRGPTDLPLARWQPEATPPPGHLMIEAYDPLTRRFESLKRKD
jgi:hypothetical protein